MRTKFYLIPLTIPFTPLGAGRDVAGREVADSEGARRDVAGREIADAEDTGTEDASTEHVSIVLGVELLSSVNEYPSQLK